MKDTNRGFIGLIALLISVAVIALIVVRSDLFSRSKENKDPVKITTDAIDDARNAKAFMEENNRKAFED